MAQFYNYKLKKSFKEIDFECEKCHWKGNGEQAQEGWDSSTGFELLCPNCDGYIDWIDGTVSLEDLEKYGDEADKAQARRRRKFLDELWASQLKSIDQLPDIDADEIIITLREEDRDNYGPLILYWGEQEIWRENSAFEYYPRFIEIGKILKEKYGERLIDFKPEEYSWLLGGDSSSAFRKVDEFRKTLHTPKN